MEFLNNVNWTALLIVACFAGFIAGLFAWAFSLLRGDKGAMAAASRWGKVLGGARDVQRQQEAQLDELHRLVSQLNDPKNNDE
jgi:hypothetical protein